VTSLSAPSDVPAPQRPAAAAAAADDAVDSCRRRRIMEPDDERVGNETNTRSVISISLDIQRIVLIKASSALFTFVLHNVANELSS